ncbi:hypothetical protein NP233_g2869 [Leucocoprinus birnbaumii]|uniref:Nephrocystin 3-like N-terminal domain-containing protein n=1 Tax=Leucocoprinus birnbaumii TaxID=56174 RepID=A0AAD5YYE4_9AGAR|nr:hypothetical protein NP233_g2869 [Leucocoprinus birnbaumii]
MSYFQNAYDFKIEGSDFFNGGTHIHNLNNIGGPGFNRLEEMALKEALRDSSAREIPRCFEGTRTAHRESITSWGKGEWKSVNARVMWMDGPAGVGKSAIAQTWADELGELLSAAFFFSRANGWNRALALFPTIAFQLATKYQSYRVAVDKAITRNPSILEMSLGAQFQALIVQPILESSPADRNAMVDTIIVIDGFDECGALSETLDSFQTQVAIMYFIFASAAHILNALRAPPAYGCTWCLTLPLEAPNVDEDIKSYFRSAFTRIRMKYPSIPSSWPSKEALAQLVKQSNGLFIYSTSAIRYIEQSSGQHRLGPEERLQLLLEPKEGTSAKLSKLDQLYLLIMGQLPRESLSNTLLILFAQDFFTTHETWRIRSTIPVMSSLLGFPQLVFNDTISPLHSVIQQYVKDGMSHPSLRFFHASFPDFLTDYQRSGFDYHIHRSDICALFHSSCVDVLSHPPRSLSSRHGIYTNNFKDTEEKDIVVRQAAFMIVFDLPSSVNYFRLSDYPNILEKMAKIDWSLEAGSYSAVTYHTDAAARFHDKLTSPWRSRIINPIKPKKTFRRIISRSSDPPSSDDFILGHGDKKALVIKGWLEPYEKR